MSLRHPFFRCVACALVTALLAGCASTKVPPIGAGRPFQLEADERRIWVDAEKEEAKLERSGKVYDDPLLEEYLGRVGDRVGGGGGVLSQTANASLGLGLQLAALAAINGYGRDIERQADEEGLARMVKAGYDPTQAPRVYQLLKKDGGDPSRLENFFFGNHPRLDERIETTSALLASRYAAEAQAPDRTVDTPEVNLRIRT